MKTTLLAALLLLTAPAFAKEYPSTSIDAKHVKTLMLEAARLSKYPKAKKFPEVVVLAKADFNEVIGSDGVWGFFAPSDPDHIVLNGAVDPTMWDTIIVHELVHFLQWKAGLLAEANLTCEDRQWVEQEAFVASYRFELARGGMNHGMITIKMKCRSEIPLPAEKP